MTSHFYAMLFRMKYIDRWAPHAKYEKESLCEHTLETAFIAHALAVIENRRVGRQYRHGTCGAACHVFMTCPK